MNNLRLLFMSATIHELIEEVLAKCQVTFLNNYLNNKLISVINKSVRLLRTMFVVLLALGWAPLTAHCQLESVTGWGLLACQPGGETPGTGSSHCDDTSCCDWESGQVHLPQNQPLTLFPLSVLVLSVVVSASNNSPPAFIGLAHLTTAPPELPKIWQFSIRAALPVRAPSFAA
jgi:hypothetical protein